jgi:tryptophan synthase alpha chain
MSYIAKYIQKLNNQNKKVLAVFLTAGLPGPKNFVDLSVNILKEGADILEIGIPFSDPIADGPVIQISSKVALDMGIRLHTVFEYSEKIKQQIEKPIVLMGYANPLLNYGLVNFMNDAGNCGVDGVIIPDIPLDEYESFWNVENKGIDRILLTTPTSAIERIRKIDQKSEGFVYCVSVTGTTGSDKKFDADTFDNIKNTYSQVKKNKMLIGFGISTPADIQRFSPFCDGVIVGSALIKRLMENKQSGYKEVLDFVGILSKACT